MSAEDSSRTLRKYWIDVYLGPPELVVHDAVENSFARAFQTNPKFIPTKMKPLLVGSPNIATFVECNHAFLRKARSIIRTELA